MARVVLLPKPARDPLLSSSYRPISILPALSKVWKHTCKNHIEKCLGRDPFHIGRVCIQEKKIDNRCVRKSLRDCRAVPEERIGLRSGRS